MKSAVALAVLLLVAACQPAAEGEAPRSSEPARPDLALTDLRVRASLGRNPNTGGYLVVENRGQGADRLVGAACDCAERVELHTVSQEDGVMRMRPVEGLDAPAGDRLALAPGGQHLMLVGLAGPLRAGDTVRLRLDFERSGAMEADFQVVADPSGGAATATDHAAH